jgi:hypothetical protein
MNTISNDTRIALLCELAHKRVKDDFQNINNYGTTKYINEDLGYTEKAQDLFNEFYDYYEGVLLNYLDLVDNPNYKKEANDERRKEDNNH